MKINIDLRISTSAVATLKDQRLRSLIKCLYVILILKDDPEEFESNGLLLQILREHSLPACQFLKEAKLGYLPWQKLFNKALITKDFSKLGPLLTEVWAIMREKSQAYSENHLLTNLYTSIIRDFRAYINSESEQAYLRLEKNAKETGEPAIYKLFIPQEKDASSQVDELKALIKKYEPGNKGLTLDLNVAKSLKERDDTVYKHYLKLKNEIKKACITEIMTYVRQSGKKLVDINVTRKHLVSVGLPNILQEGFVGQIDENGNYYTIKGKTNEGRQLKSNPGGPCTMNPTYKVDEDNTYVFKSQTPGAKDTSSFYTLDYGASSQSDKYEQVLENMPIFDGAREKWISDIKGSKTSEKWLYAVLCEMVFLSMARIGSKNVNVSSKGEYKGQNTYGIRTLLCKHARLSENKVTITYLGVKTSAHLKHFVYTDTPQGKIIYDYIAERKASAKPNDPIFVAKGKMASNEKLKEYLTSTGLTIGIHKFRTVRGTRLFQKLVANNRTLSAKTTSDPKRVETEIDKILEAVGKELGHYTTTPDGTKITGSTALQYYIVPSLVFDLYKKFEVRMPPKVQKVWEIAQRGSDDNED